MTSCPLCPSANANQILEIDQKHKGRNTVRINYFECTQCKLRFLPSTFFPAKEDEKARYLEHQNNEGDQKYKDYLNQLIAPLATLIKSNTMILDYGCGPTRGYYHLLESKVDQIDSFDPHFFSKEPPSSNKYDLVLCSEVVEHFQSPKEDWKKLFSFPHSNGILAIRTKTYPEKIQDFKEWYYRRDITHVSFYHPHTLRDLALTYNQNFFQEDDRFYFYNTNSDVFKSLSRILKRGI